MSPQSYYRKVPSGGPGVRSRIESCHVKKFYTIKGMPPRWLSHVYLIFLDSLSVLSLSLKHTHTHTHIHIRKSILSFLILSLSLARAPSLSASLSRTHTHSEVYLIFLDFLSLARSLSHSLSHSHAHARKSILAFLIHIRTWLCGCLHPAEINKIKGGFWPCLLSV
jgi:hypothetical protein